MEEQKVEFASHDGGGKLVGRLHHPPAPRAFALFAHCFTCSKDIRAAVRISRALADCGIATLRFDFTGLGESSGDFSDTNFSSNVDDLVAAADFLRAEYRAPALLIGHSLGGAAVLAAAGRVPEARAVATVGAPCDAKHVRKLFADSHAKIEADGEAEVSIAGRCFRIKKQLLDDLDSQANPEKLSTLGKSLMVLHSPQDNVVDIENARCIFMAARHPKSFISLDGADHLLQREDDARYVGSVLASWASRYLPQEIARVDDGAPRRVVVESAPQGLAQAIQLGPHHLRADEPVSLKGADSGPTPYDLLLAGLGACTSMTLRMYANHKKWPLTGVRVELRHQKIHAKDCDECQTTEGMLDDIERLVWLDGDLDAEQRARLLEIADRCPVHRTLHREVRVRSKLVESDVVEVGGGRQ